MIFEIKIAAALLADQLLGDPSWLPHPVRGIGLLCLRFEKTFRDMTSSKRLAGFFSVISVIAVTVVVTVWVIELAASFSPLLADFVSILVLYTSIATKDLILHSRKVYACLYPSVHLTAARDAVSMIVGRDTKELDKEGICRACIETVAENMVDGVTAPLFFSIVFSMFSSVEFNNIELAAIGAITYKAINTMDSMFGYKNERYLEFGWSAAKLDDIANFIPARISGIMVVLSARILGLDWKGSAKIFLRDRLQHSSPNSAHTEAAVAGALGIQLGGDSSYFGKLVRKPTIGDPKRSVREDDILLAGRIIQIGALLFAAILLLLRRCILEV